MTFTGFLAQFVAFFGPLISLVLGFDAVNRERTQRTLMLLYASPITLDTDATAVLLDPFQRTTRSLALMGPRERRSLSRFQRPLPLGQSALVAAPHLILLVAMTLACFGLGYAFFVCPEVRTT